MSNRRRDRCRTGIEARVYTYSWGKTSDCFREYQQLYTCIHVPIYVVLLARNENSKHQSSGVMSFMPRSVISICAATISTLSSAIRSR